MGTVISDVLLLLESNGTLRYERKHKNGNLRASPDRFCSKYKNI